MKNLVRKPLAWAADLPRKAHVKLLITVDGCMQNPRERRLMLGTAAITSLGLFAGTAAHADGLADLFTKTTDQSDSIKPQIGKLFAFAGFALAGTGGYNWWRKGKEGEDSRIKGGQIAIPIVAGAALGATGFLLIKAGETVGIGGGSHGALPED